jgi:hypothetical protein
MQNDIQEAKQDKDDADMLAHREEKRKENVGVFIPHAIRKCLSFQDPSRIP